MSQQGTAGEFPPPGPSGPWPPPRTPDAGTPGAWPPPGVPAERLAFPHPEPTPYHQMLRTWTYAWWRPLVGLGLLAVCFLVVQLLAAALLVAIAAASAGSFLENLGSLADLEKVGPGFLLLLNLSLGAMILLSWVPMRLVHRLRPRWLASVAPRMRWRFLAVCLAVSVVALVAQVVVSAVVPMADTGLTGELNPVTGTTVALGLVVLLTTPLQAAGEEYLFRGYLLQAVGSLLGWSRQRSVQLLSKWGAIVVTALLFAAAHGAQNFPLFFDRFMFGMIAGWLIIRTGGLEAGVAMHVLNNFLALGAAILVGDLGESLMISEASWWNIPVTLTQAGVYALLVVAVARRMGIQTHTRPPAPAAAPPAPGLPAHGAV